jgi:hypothetical protein
VFGDENEMDEASARKNFICGLKPALEAVGLDRLDTFPLHHAR